MLFIEASIGDFVNVTFVKADKGVQTQESINGRRCFLDRKSASARPGDRCRVKIVAENPKQSVYFLQVVSLIKAGDGESSLLEKVIDCLESDIEWQRSVSSRTLRAIALATRYCGGDLALLELLTDLLAHYSFQRDFSNCDCHWVCSNAEKIIVRQFASQPISASEAYYRLAEAIGDGSREQTLVRRLLRKALAVAEKSVPQHLERTLEALDICEERLTGKGSIAIKTRLLELHEQNKGNGLDAKGRINLASAYLEEQKGHEALALLEPLMEQPQPLMDGQGNDVTALVINSFGRAHYVVKDYEKASFYLARGLPLKSHEQMRMLAECLLFTNEFERSAFMFRKALEECEKCLENAFN